MSGAEAELTPRGASLEEAAAALAAIERYIRERDGAARTAPAADPWARVARLEAVGEADTDLGWADPHPWGR